MSARPSWYGATTAFSLNMMRACGREQKIEGDEHHEESEHEFPPRHVEEVVVRAPGLQRAGSAAARVERAVAVQEPLAGVGNLGAKAGIGRILDGALAEDVCLHGVG